MKNYVNSTIAIIFASSLSLTGCFDIAPGATDAEASLKQTMAQSLTMELPNTACDYDNRETEMILKEETGIVTRMNNPAEPETPVFIIQNPNNSMRYVACNMPAGLKSDGMKVTFDAEKKRVGDEERWIAHPIKLTRIHNSSNGGSFASNN